MTAHQRVNRTIADNMGVAFFDSLLVDDLEEGPDDETEQRVQESRLTDSRP